MKLSMRVMALVMALLLAFAAAAMAEPSSIYSIEIANPVIEIFGSKLDMTRLKANVSAAMDDNGNLALILGAGLTDGANLLQAAAQPFARSVAFTLSGVKNAYSMDLTEYIASLLREAGMSGMENYIDFVQLLAAMELRSKLNSVAIDWDRGFDSSYLITRGKLVDALFALADPASSSAARSVHISEDEGQALLIAMFEYAKNYSGISAANIDYDETIQLIQMLDIVMTIDGTSSVTEANARAELLLNLFMRDDDESMITIAVTYADDLKDTYQFTVKVSLDDEESVTMTLKSGTTATPDGVKPAHVFAIEELGITAAFSSYKGVNESDNLWINLADMITFQSSCGYALNVRNSIRLALSSAVPDNTLNVAFAYEGNHTETDARKAHIGKVNIAFANEEIDLAAGFDIVLANTTADSSAWLINTANTIDLSKMTEDQQNAAIMEAMVALSTALEQISEAVPVVGMLLSDF